MVTSSIIYFTADLVHHKPWINILKQQVLIEWNHLFSSAFQKDMFLWECVVNNWINIQRHDIRYNKHIKLRRCLGFSDTTNSIGSTLAFGQSSGSKESSREKFKNLSGSVSTILFLVFSSERLLVVWEFRRIKFG